MVATTSSEIKDTKSETSEMRMKANQTRNSFQRPSYWVLIFGWSLAMCAGLVNTVAFESWGMYVSHVTGDTTAIGRHLENWHHGAEFLPLGNAVALLLSFLFGAFLCGLLIDKNQVHFGGKSFYGIALVGNAALLVLAILVPQGLPAACLAAMACGLQNAMCTSHFGAIVRTTHVTGTVTDIGSTSGRIVMILMRRGFRVAKLNVVDRAEICVDARKLGVLFPMWVSYLVGTILGAYLVPMMQVYALLLPASLTLTVGIVYMFFRTKLKGMLKRIERERLNKDLVEVQVSLERSQSYLNHLRKEHTAEEPDEENFVISVDEEVGHMLETIHDLEANLETLASETSQHSIEDGMARRANSARF